MQRRNWPSASHFNPRSPYGERHIRPGLPPTGSRISIHAPLTGSDNRSRRFGRCRLYFNPRSPYGERHESTAQIEADLQFQSTLPLRGATLVEPVETVPPTISIHAPLTGSDRTNDEDNAVSANFNPRSPYGERPLMEALDQEGWAISIHAPLTGSDFQTVTVKIYINPYFNPRSPYGERRPTDILQSDTI